MMIFICFYSMFCLATLASYFVFYKKRYTDEIMLYLKLTKAMQAPDFEQSKAAIFEDDDGEITLAKIQTKQILNDIYNAEQPYPERKRRYGEGSLRIGSSVGLSEDIYCITYLSMMNADHISVFINIETGVPNEVEEREAIRA